MIYCPMSQITRVAQRSALSHGYNVTCACPSPHSRWADGSVTRTVVWGRVQINQLLLFPSHQSVAVVVSLMKLVIQEWHSDGWAVFLFQFLSNRIKRGQLFPARFYVTASGDAMTLAFLSEFCTNNLVWIKIKMENEMVLLSRRKD